MIVDFSKSESIAVIEDQCRIEKVEIQLETLTSPAFLDTFKQAAKPLAEIYSTYYGMIYTDAYIRILTQAVKRITRGDEPNNIVKDCEYMLIKRRREKGR